MGYFIERNEIREVHGHGDSEHYVTYDIRHRGDSGWAPPHVRVIGEVNYYLAQDILNFMNSKLTQS